MGKNIQKKEKEQNQKSISKVFQGKDTIIITITTKEEEEDLFLTVHLFLHPELLEE